MHQKPSSQKRLTVLTLLYGGLLLYASLMPYDFMEQANLPRLWHSAWNQWPFNPRARLSASDLLSNLVLYIPLGFLLASRCRMAYLSPFKSLAITILTCSLLSCGIELLQGLTISRTMSATDWVSNSFSGFLGAAAGARHGAAIWSKVVDWIDRRFQSHPLDIFTLAFMGLLAADALAPFLPTISPSQVWRNLKQSHFYPLEGLAQHPWHWWLVGRVLIYATLTFLLASWKGADAPYRKWRRAIPVAFFFMLGLELAKIFIASRSFNIANVFTSTTGIIAAALALPIFFGRLSRNRKLNLAILALAGYGLYLAWTPFDFAWDLAQLRQKFPALIELLPFYHYAMGASLNHARLFVQHIALMTGLIYFLRLRFTEFDENRSKLLLAVTIAIIAGLMQEGGQLFLPDRTPSMTDIYCLMIGAAVGAGIKSEQSKRNH